VLSGRGLCDELITRPEKSYRLCCVVVCDLETSRVGAPYIYDISNLRVNFVSSKNTINTYRGVEIWFHTLNWGLRQHHALAALSAVKELLYPFHIRVGVDPRVHVDATDEGSLHLPEVEPQFHGRPGSNVLAILTGR
jgi:hypothetical protein